MIIIIKKKLFSNTVYNNRNHNVYSIDTFAQRIIFLIAFRSQMIRFRLSANDCRPNPLDLDGDNNGLHWSSTTTVVSYRCVRNGFPTDFTERPTNRCILNTVRGRTVQHLLGFRPARRCDLTSYGAREPSKKKKKWSYKIIRFL